MGERKKRLSRAMVFLLLFGVVSLFSDMTHEGASSIRGAYLTLMGASAGVIGFVSGLGELVGYSMRYVFGRLTDRTKRYWSMTILGYVLDVVAVPALALVGEGGWIWACGLLVVQRMGKAIKKPAKDTLMSFAASREGVGKSFGIQELLRRSFRPEFLNRLDEIVFYKPLTKDNITHIIDLLVEELNHRLSEKQLKVALTEQAKRFIIDSAYDPAFGARPLRRFVQHSVETLISRKIIADQVQPGDTLTVDCVNGELTVETKSVLTGQVVDQA